MKTWGSSVRFVVVSATVPNISDVSAWIGSHMPNNVPATVFQVGSFGLDCLLLSLNRYCLLPQFGPEFRPCKLERFVYGIPRKRDQNDFQYNQMLDYKLYAIIEEHACGKPMLIFCSTRKGIGTAASRNVLIDLRVLGVLSTAQQLVKEYEEAARSSQKLPWALSTRFHLCVFRDKFQFRLNLLG